jgi:hypothetical protein
MGWQEVWCQAELVCFWSNALTPSVYGGSDLVMSGLLGVLYNFWMWFLYMPIGVLFLSFKSVFATIVPYTPIGYGLYRIYQRLILGIVEPRRET